MLLELLVAGSLASTLEVVVPLVQQQQALQQLVTMSLVALELFAQLAVVLKNSMGAMIDLVLNSIIMACPKMDLHELVLVVELDLTFKLAEMLELAQELLLAKAGKLVMVLMQSMVFLFNANPNLQAFSRTFCQTYPQYTPSTFSIIPLHFQISH